MKVVSIKIWNFRSIDYAEIQLSNYTVILGPNNIGKTNLLKAINIAISTVSGMEVSRLRRKNYYNRNNFDNVDYNWSRDIPIQKQDNPDVTSNFVIVFEMSESELELFNNTFRSNFGNNRLTMSLKIGRNRITEYKIKRQGKGSGKFVQMSAELQEFISKHIRPNYTQGIRTDEFSYSIIDSLFNNIFIELREKNEEYRKYIQMISSIEENELKKLKEKITPVIKKFIPEMKKLDISTNVRKTKNDIYNDIFIEDSFYTPLQEKGDGFKSIFAMALAEYISENVSTNVVYCIEEPESHLHSDAIHRIKDTLLEMSKTSQIIISTHSPIFIDRNRLSSNIIVEKGRTQKCNSIKEIRNALGIQLSESLLVAETVLFVEGETDEMVFSSFLSKRSVKCFNALENGTLLIVNCGGLENYEKNYDMYDNFGCKIRMIIDNDTTGREVLKRLRSNDRINQEEYTILKKGTLKNTELEDFISESIYLEALQGKMKVDLNNDWYKNKSNGKWSDRINLSLSKQGKEFYKEDEVGYKYFVAKLACENQQSLFTDATDLADSIIKMVENSIC